jgi:hypothetical protein
MCWNSTVSLNTFLFSFCSLLLIIYNNKYTKYKIKEINSFGVYIFFLSFIIVQLIEYFIWKNLNNQSLNKILTRLVYIIVFCQPICSLMIINNKSLRNKLLFIYLFLVFIIFIFFLFIKESIKSYKDNNNHLVWDANIEYPLYIFNDICYSFFLTIGLFIEQKWAILIIGFLSYSIVISKHLKNMKNIKNLTIIQKLNNFHNSVDSVWCWSVNLIILYYLSYLLIYLPFIQK